jgi:hypothetical protein
MKKLIIYSGSLFLLYCIASFCIFNFISDSQTTNFIVRSLGAGLGVMSGLACSKKMKQSRKHPKNTFKS